MTSLVNMSRNTLEDIVKLAFKNNNVKIIHMLIIKRLVTVEECMKQSVEKNNTIIIESLLENFPSISLKSRLIKKRTFDQTRKCNETKEELFERYANGSLLHKLNKMEVEWLLKQFCEEHDIEDVLDNYEDN